LDDRTLARKAAEAAISKKARDVEILDVSSKVDYTHYIVLCTANVERHAQAILEEIETRLKKQGVRALGVEGFPACQWMLIDYGDVIIHVFLENARTYYDLDSLWIDADRVRVEHESSAKK